MKGPFYTLFATVFGAWKHTKKAEKKGWEEKHRATLESLVVNYLPSGSGWNCATKCDTDRSRVDRLIFYGSYYHMDEHGRYECFTDHEIIVTPSLAQGFTLRITGPDKHGIKDYLYDLFDEAMSQEAEIPVKNAPAVNTEDELEQLAWVFLTKEGCSFQPGEDDSLGQLDSNNLQVIGFTKGINQDDAFKNLKNENEHLTETTFNEVFCYPLLEDYEDSRKHFYIKEMG